MSPTWLYSLLSPFSLTYTSNLVALFLSCLLYSQVRFTVLLYPAFALTLGASGIGILIFAFASGDTPPSSLITNIFLSFIFSICSTEIDGNSTVKDVVFGWLDFSWELFELSDFTSTDKPTSELSLFFSISTYWFDPSDLTPSIIALSILSLFFSILISFEPITNVLGL